MPSDELVKVSKLVRYYKRGKLKVSALTGVDLSVNKEEIIGVVGPSGSGKTSLLNVIGGLGKASSGNIIVDGSDLSQLGDTELSNFRLKKIGFIFQFYNLISTLNAIENVEIPMSLAGVEREKKRQRAKELLGIVGMGHRADHLPDQMSGGEQQRVAVARALANSPPIILGDEPTGDLDSKSAKKLVELIRALRRDNKVAFVLVTHDPLVVEGCDRVYSIRDGKVIKEFSQTDINHFKLAQDRDGMDHLLL
jgi:putative ABC transport system ATP-binding protein